MKWIRQFVIVLCSKCLFAEADGLHYVSQPWCIFALNFQIQPFEQAVADHPSLSPGLILASRSLQMLSKQSLMLGKIHLKSLKSVKYLSGSWKDDSSINLGQKLILYI